MMTNANYPDSSEPTARIGGKKPPRSGGRKSLFPNAYPKRGWSGGEFLNQSKPLRPQGGQKNKRG